MKIEMLKTRNIPNIGNLEEGKKYTVNTRLGEQLIGQGLALDVALMAPARPKASKSKSTKGDKL